MVANSFAKISAVPTADTIVGTLLANRQRGRSRIAHEQYAIEEIRAFYEGKVAMVQNACTETLAAIHDSSPRLDSLHPFYVSLLDLQCSAEHCSLALRRLRDAMSEVLCIGVDQVSLLRVEDSPDRCQDLERTAAEQFCTVVKELTPTLALLEKVRQHLAQMPDVNPMARTLLLCGCPNVGKSALMNQIVEGHVSVPPHAPTTSISVSYCKHSTLPWQVIDTPGLVDCGGEEQAMCALRHLDACALFVLDCSSDAACSIEQQVSVFSRLRFALGDKPVVMVLSKADVGTLTRTDQALLDSLQVECIRWCCADAESAAHVEAVGCARLLAWTGRAPWAARAAERGNQIASEQYRAQHSQQADRRGRGEEWHDSEAEDEDEEDEDEYDSEEEEEEDESEEQEDEEDEDEYDSEEEEEEESEEQEEGEDEASGLVLAGRLADAKEADDAEEGSGETEEVDAMEKHNEMETPKQVENVGRKDGAGGMKLLDLPWALIGRCWAGERVVLGLRVCTALRESLAEHAREVLLVRRPEVKGVSEQELKTGLARVASGGAVSLAWGCASSAVPGVVRTLWVAGLGRVLRRLQLRGSKVGRSAGELTRGLQVCSALAWLDLSEGRVDARAMRVLAGGIRECTGLEWVAMRENPLRAKGVGRLVGALQGCRGLRHLDVRDTEMETEGMGRVMDGVGAWEDLSSLQVEYNGIVAGRVRGLERLAGCRALQTLQFGANSVSDEEGGGSCEYFARVLGQCTGLREVGLGVCKIGTGSWALAEGLLRLERLSALDLSNNNVDTELLVNLLVRSPALARLSLRAVYLRNPELTHMAAALEGCPSLTHLDLRNLGFGEAGLCALAWGLAACSGLTTLQLGDSSCASFETHSVGQVGEALGRLGASLQDLELGRMQMGPARFAALVPGLCRCSALTALDVRHNRFGDEGALRLAEAVRGYTALKRLDVVGNGIGDDSAGRLGEALHEGCGRLERWNLRENLVSEEQGRRLRRRLPRCAVMLETDKVPDRGEIPLSWL